MFTPPIFFNSTKSTNPHHPHPHLLRPIPQQILSPSPRLTRPTRPTGPPPHTHCPRHISASAGRRLCLTPHAELVEACGANKAKEQRLPQDADLPRPHPFP